MGKKVGQSGIPADIWQKQCLQGRRNKIGQGERNILACARENSPALSNFPPLGMIFAPLWAYFSIFSLLHLYDGHVFRGGTSPPALRSSARGTSPSPPSSTPMVVEHPQRSLKGSLIFSEFSHI